MEFVIFGGHFEFCGQLVGVGGKKSSELLIASKIPTVFRLSQIRSQIIQIILGFRPDRQNGHQRKQIPRIDKVSHIYKTTKRAARTYNLFSNIAAKRRVEKRSFTILVHTC